MSTHRESVAAAKSVSEGDDPAHDLDDAAKDKLEPKLRADAKEAFRQGNPKKRAQLNARADEISRPKSRRGHQGRDH